MEVPFLKRAFFSLTVQESKLLISKAVCELEEVKSAMKEGCVIVARGTTNAYVASQLAEVSVDKGAFSAGIITEGRPCATSDEARVDEFIFVNGRLSDVKWTEKIKEFKRGDVFIKGANAIDSEGNCGVLLGHNFGGTMGASMHILTSRGSQIVVPVSLEKLVPSVEEACCDLGIDNLDYSLGMPCGMMMMPKSAIVVTELEALEILFDVRATHVASGGIDGSEGSVVLSIVGEESDVKRAFDYILSIKGEPQTKAYKTKCSDCKISCYSVRG